MKIANHIIEGQSRSGYETCFVLPEFKLVLDIGVCTEQAAKTQMVLVTHAHVDHLAGAVQHAFRRSLLGMSPSKFVVPVGVVSQVREILTLWSGLQGDRVPFEVIPTEPGNTIQVSKDVLVRVVPTSHIEHSQGYVIYRVSQKLKPEFVGLPGEEIEKLKRAGTQITDRMETPEVAYMLDSQFEAVAACQTALKARLLIMEATFFGAETVEQAHKYGHTHLSEIVASADLFQNEAVVLTHFSARYSDEQIQEAMAGLPEPLKSKVTPV